MDVVADLPADTQPAEPVQQREGLLDDPPIDTQPGTVVNTSAGEHRLNTLNTLTAHQFAVLVVVVGTIGVHPLGPLTRTPTPAADRRDGLDQRHQLGDVVAVATGQGRCQRDTATVGDHMVFGARTTSVDRTRTSFGPPFTART
jgi:hypothetical protein